jgi:hypothetical protein
MNAKAERQMVTGMRAADHEAVRLLDLIGIAVARDLPHCHLVPSSNALPIQFGVA